MWEEAYLSDINYRYLYNFPRVFFGIIKASYIAAEITSYSYISLHVAMATASYYRCQNKMLAILAS